MTTMMTEFENALVDLIDIFLKSGLTGSEVQRVLKARADDDFDAVLREIQAADRLLPDIPKLEPITETVRMPDLSKKGARA